MDLVDIDKVLDDLELDENDSKCAGNAKNTTNVHQEACQMSLQQAEQSQPKLESVLASLPTTLAAEANNNEKTTQAKSFVNITNVFSSLQEYVDVDIDHIIRAADPAATFEAVNDAKRNEVEVPGSDTKDNNDDDDECTDAYPEDVNGGALTSASSITTSSPSSFSSGPSPGSTSESSDSFVHEDRFNITSKQNNENKYALPAQRLKHAAETSELESESTDIGNEVVVGADVRIQLENARNGEENSIELGLSSISSCLYNENTSSSFPGLSNDLCKLDALSSIPSSSTPKDSDRSVSEEITGSYCDNSNVREHPTAINTAEQEENATEADQKVFPSNALKNEPQLKPTNQQSLVGFGSTMDEISDTELDSILQEIDSDLQVFQGIKSSDVENQSAKEASCLPDDDKINENPETPSAIQESVIDKCASQASAEENKDKTLETEDECPDNHVNMDNFSQASTVEFADTRIQTDFDNDANPVQSISCDDLQPNESTNKDACALSSMDEQETASTVPTKTGQQRPNSLDIPVQSVNMNSTAGQTPPAPPALDDEHNTISNSSSDDLSPQSTYNQATGGALESSRVPTPEFTGDSKLGKVPPFWIPDCEAPVCMQCQVKFSLIKRRHHCRACGLVLCSTCCSQKAKLEFLGNAEVRVCVQCHLILRERSMVSSSHTSRPGGETNEINGPLNRPPNPNNPMEYCSVIPPHQQVTDAAVAATNPISVMVPVGVLKREGVPPKNNRKDKNVIFSDGIRPGCDLAELDDSWDNKGESSSSSRKSNSGSKKLQMPSGLSSPPYHGSSNVQPKSVTSKSHESDSFIPESLNGLPPIYTKNITESEWVEVVNDAQLISRLKTETLQFAVQRNFFVYVKIVKLKCCVNKVVINFTTQGMHHVGQDEIIILLEYDENANSAESRLLPKDIFVHLNQIYCDANRGRTIGELGFSVPSAPTFLGSRDHGGFLYIRPTFQCLLELQLPDAPFLIGILIHKWEIPWARVFPLRLMLRLGAQYRYYPSPHVSVAFRDPVYGEIAQTIINFLADFRNYSYTLATIRGMYIHMEDRKTNAFIPRNRHDQILKALNNSSDHILALGGNLSKKADGHLVCIQNMGSNCAETHTYSTQAINIQGQPRKVTGASFLVLNGALKSTSGLQGKCSIVEDGLMVQILPAKMALVRTALQNKENIEIICGPIDANETQTEIVNILWTDDDIEFNIDVKSPIDGKKMDGIPSIRVHSGLNYSNVSHMIRWAEVFIIQMENESPHDKDAIDVQKISEHIAKSASTALVSFLDLLAASGCVKIGLRVTLHQDNVCYETGSLNAKLPPLYMNALDNELIPMLHRQATSLHGIEVPIILELMFYILDK